METKPELIEEYVGLTATIRLQKYGQSWAVEKFYGYMGNTEFFTDEAAAVKLFKKLKSKAQ